MKKKIINILLIILFIVLLSFIIFKVSRIGDGEDTSKIDIPIENASNENRYFNCTRPEIVQPEYTIGYNYYFSFKENKLNEAIASNIIKFSNKKAYDAYKFNASDDLKYIEEFDEKGLTKIYKLTYLIPQKTEGENVLDEYLKMLMEQGLTCAEDLNTLNPSK